jgi:uncharacterized membrane protein HdeD (DUF308 family)
LNGIVLFRSHLLQLIFHLPAKEVLRLESILDLFFLDFFLFNPFMTFILYPMLIGCWILCFGIIKIGVSLLVRNRVRGWLFVLFIGLLSIGFAIGILYAPSTRAKDITIIIGAFFLILFSVLLYDSIKL